MLEDPLLEDRLLEGLDDAQREAVTTRAAPLAILAGAGAGKTRVLTRRIAWQARHAHIDPGHTLAVTFTRKAAGELGDRLTRLGVRRQVAAGTFHAIALAQLRRRCEDHDRPMPKLLDRKARLLVPMLPGRGGERSDLCVVGDGDQAIYGFAGADASYLTSFGEHFPGASVVRLGTNYRSSPQVVSAAAAVLETSGDRAGVRSSRPEGPLPVVRSYPSDEAEAEGVARSLRRDHPPGTPWSSAAVLYRTNAQSALFEEALRREGVPFRVRGGGRFLDRPEVQVALETLRARTRAQPGVPFAGHLEALAESTADASEERREHVEAIGRLGRDYLVADGGNGSLGGFLEFLQTALRAGDDTGAASGDAVELLSFHRAKGLEFDTVFVAGLETGLVPIVRAETPSDKAEELRLLYVALSRAERALHVSWAQKRTMGMRTYRRTPTPWLAPIEATVWG